jgi:hypothetical protein
LRYGASELPTSDPYASFSRTITYTWVKRGKPDEAAPVVVPDDAFTRGDVVAGGAVAAGGVVTGGGVIGETETLAQPATMVASKKAIAA